MKWKYRLIALFVLIFSVTLSSAGTVNVQAKQTKQAKVVKKNVTTHTKMNFGIRIPEKPASKLKWSTSDKNVIKIKGYEGKRRRIVWVKAGKKAGKCKLKAKVGNKTYVYNITVKNIPKSQLTMLKKNIQVARSAKKYPGDVPDVEIPEEEGWWSRVTSHILVDVVYMNYTPREVDFPYYYNTIEKLEDGQWVDVTPAVNCDRCMAASLWPWSESLQTYTIWLTEEDEENFISGAYRMYLDYDDDTAEEDRYVVQFTL